MNKREIPGDSEIFVQMSYVSELYNWGDALGNALNLVTNGWSLRTQTSS